MERILLIQRELRELPDDTKVYVVMDAVEKDGRYRGAAYTTQMDDGCMLSLGSPDATFGVDWDYSSHDDSEDCDEPEDMDGTTLSIYHWKTPKGKA